MSKDKTLVLEDKGKVILNSACAVLGSVENARDIIAIAQQNIHHHYPSQQTEPQAPVAPDEFQRPTNNVHFIDRPKLLGDITQCFQKKAHETFILVVYGLGGMGKTELAQHYYLSPPHCYRFRAWFHAASEEALSAQYIALAKEQGIEFAEKTPVAQQVSRVKQWLAQREDALLIYDNLPNATFIEEFLPPQGNAHVLITSHNAVGWRYKKLPVDVMAPSEAIALIEKITQRADDAAAMDQLINTLGYLPLALAQAGAYMEVKSTTAQAYLKRYERHKKALLTDKNPLSPKHAPVWITFTLNFEALAGEAPLALGTLKQASWLNDNAIPEILLQKGLMAQLHKEGTELKEGDALLTWDDIKEHIAHYSLMNINVEKQQWSIHSLLQEILRLQQDDAEKVRSFTQIYQAIDNLYALYDEQGSLDYTALLIHAEKVHQHGQDLAQLKEVEKKFVEIPGGLSTVPFNLGHIYQDMGLYPQALTFFQQQLNIKEAHYGPEHPDTARVLHDLGNAYGSLGDYTQQKAVLIRALPILEKHYGPEHPETARTLGSLGNAYGDLGDSTQRKVLLTRALVIFEKHYGPEHPQTARTLANLGNTYGLLGDPEQQQALLTRALVIFEKHYGLEHPETASILANLGNAYGSLGDSAQQKAFLIRALAINEKHYGLEHPKTARILASLSNAYGSLGDSAQQQALLIRLALAIFEKHYGPEHPHTASILASLGNACRSLGEYPQAKGLFTKRS